MSNKGKKYVKLRGNEIATPENEARARLFLEWYGDNARDIRDNLIYARLYDDEIATDTMLNVYNSIALKGLKIRHDYKYYFMCAYHTNYRAAKMRKNAQVVVSIDAQPYDGASLAEKLAAPDFDYETYEQTIDAFKTEITDYVRTNYDPAACSIFEIYIALQPDISYKRLAKMLGFPVQQIWPVIGSIKKDIVATFSDRRAYFLSSLF